MKLKISVQIVLALAMPEGSCVKYWEKDKTF